MSSLILAAVYVAVECVLLAGLAAAALLVLAAAVHPCRKADRALADVRAAQDREVPDRIDDELTDWEHGSWEAIRRDRERYLVEREPYDWAGDGL